MTIRRKLAVVAATAVFTLGCGGDEIVGPVGTPATEVPVGLTDSLIVLGEVPGARCGDAGGEECRCRGA